MLYSHQLSCMRIVFIVLMICLCSSFVVSCDNFSGPLPGKTVTTSTGGNTGTGGTTGGTNACDTTNITFSKTVLPILEANCVGCHSGPSATAGVDLSSFTGLKRVVSSNRFPNVLTGTSGAPQMPPGSRLSACDISRIQAWVRKGANND
jgi:hypothetical protein